MAIISDGKAVTMRTLGSLLEAGGDASAIIPQGSLDDPTSRGMHMLAAFVAPMDAYYEDWIARVDDAAGEAIEDWRIATGTHDQKWYVNSAIMEANAGLVQAAIAADGTVKEWDEVLHAPAAHGVSLRRSLALSLSTVDAWATAVRLGIDDYSQGVEDFHNAAMQHIKLKADQGMTSARTLGDVLQFSGQVQQLVNQRFSLVEGQAELKARQEYDKKAREQANDSALGGIIGTVVGAFL